MTMIERAKAAMNETYQTFGQRGDLRTVAISDACAEAMVRAVVAALREPTEVMDKAGRYRCHGVDVNDGSMRRACGGYLGETASEQWRRMIDAILSEHPD